MWVVRDAIGGEVDDCGDEVVTEENATNRFPISSGLSDEETDRLHRHLDHLGWVTEGPHLNKMMPLYRLHGYRCVCNICTHVHYAILYIYNNRFT